MNIDIILKQNKYKNLLNEVLEEETSKNETLKNEEETCPISQTTIKII